MREDWDNYPSLHSFFFFFACPTVVYITANNNLTNSIEVNCLVLCDSMK